jgi:hypothetical protein
MSEVVLQIDDAIGLEKVMSLLSPYISVARVKEPTGEVCEQKIWDGNMDWLGETWEIPYFKPIPREELYDRKSIH